MRIISIANQKGGVGKTTTTVNLVGALAKCGQKVIVIDLDPQAHLTTCFGLDPRDLETTAYEVLCKETKLADALLDIGNNIKLLSSSLDLAAVEQELSSVIGRETVLSGAIEAYDEPVDYIFIDCPPSLGMLTLNAFSASREIFIPLQAHFLSLQGLSQLLEMLMLVNKRINPNLSVSGLLFCMFDARTSLSAEILKDITTFFEEQRDQESPWQHIKLFDTKIRRNIKLAEAPSYGVCIFDYALESNGAQDYLSLANEVIAMDQADAQEITLEALQSKIKIQNKEKDIVDGVGLAQASPSGIKTSIPH